MPFVVFRRGSFAVHIGDHLRLGIICGPIWGSFAVGDHLRRRTEPFLPLLPGEPGRPRGHTFTRPWQIFLKLDDTTSSNISSMFADLLRFAPFIFRVYLFSFDSPALFLTLKPPKTPFFGFSKGGEENLHPGYQNDVVNYM